MTDSELHRKLRDLHKPLLWWERQGGGVARDACAREVAAEVARRGGHYDHGRIRYLATDGQLRTEPSR